MKKKERRGLKLKKKLEINWGTYLTSHRPQRPLIKSDAKGDP